jgi:hypothetical protein
MQISILKNSIQTKKKSADEKLSVPDGIFGCRHLSLEENTFTI